MRAKDKSLTGIQVGPCEQCGRAVYITSVALVEGRPDRATVVAECEGDGTTNHVAIHPAKVL